MTDIEQEYFKYLHQDRLNLATVLKAPYLEQIWADVVSPGKSAVSGVQELLKYANAAQAISARFILESDRLIFAHNGVQFFSVTDPFLEDKAEDDEIGSVNALTSPNLWKKDNNEPFARWFRSIFQYTRSPEFYDPGVWFRLDEYIVPELLSEDASERQLEETLLVLPFDRPDIPPEVVYAKIAAQLKALDSALLFLPNLLKLEWRIGDSQEESYTREVIEERESYGLRSQTLLLSTSQEDEKTLQRFLVYSRPEEKADVCVAFKLSDRGEITPVKSTAYAVFPTLDTTFLPFLVQAPFSLFPEENRIHTYLDENIALDEALASLCVNALLHLRDWTQGDGYRLSTDFVRSLLIQSARFPDHGNASPFSKTYSAIRRLFKTEAIFPTEHGYVAASDAYWTDVPEIFALFDDERLRQLTSNTSAAWIFRSDAKANRIGFLQDIDAYLETLGVHKLTEHNLLERGRVISYIPQKPRITSALLSESFIAKQDFSWLHTLYAWLAASPRRREWAKTAPIFFNTSRVVRPLFKNEKLSLFLPPETGSEEPFDIIHPVLLENMQTHVFIQSLGIAAPPLRDQIYKGLLPQYKHGARPADPAADFQALFSYYLECPSSESSRYMQELRTLPFLMTITDAEEAECSKGSQLYFPDDDLRAYFSAAYEAKYIDIQVYLDLIEPDQKPYLMRFLEELGVQKVPRLGKISYTQDEAEELGLPVPDSGRTCRYVETTIAGCLELLTSLGNTPAPARSMALFKQLRALDSKHGPLKYVIRGECDYYTDGPQVESFKPTIVAALQSVPWIQLKDGSFGAPADICLSQLHKRYETEDPIGRQILEFLEIPDDIADPLVKKHRDLERVGMLCEEYSLEQNDLALLAAIKHEGEGSESAALHLPKIPGLLADIARTAWDVAMDSSLAPPKEGEENTAQVTALEKQLRSAQQDTILGIRQIATDEDLLNDFRRTEPYTYGWLSRLLQLELLSARSVDAHFSFEANAVSEVPGHPEKILLKLPDFSYPAWLDNADSLQLTITADGHVENLLVNAVEPDPQGLRVSVADSGAQWNRVTKAVLSVWDPKARLSWLLHQWQGLGFSEDFDLFSHLPVHTEFILGAPGTGKTTRLVQRAIPSFLAADPGAHILVLGANEADADVLMDSLKHVQKLMGLPGEGIVRIGKEPVPLPTEVTGPVIGVASVQRVLFEAYMHTEPALLDYAWSYGLIDDASLVPLPEILFLLYRLRTRKCIISGDPCFKSAWTSLEAWKEENIFTFLGLDSCVPDVAPDYPFDFQVLTRQFRSVPSIGELINSLVYEGILTHTREEPGSTSLQLGDQMPLAALSITEFPVSMDGDDIYRLRQLGKSGSYSIYAGLLVFECIASIADRLKKSARETLRIGVLCSSAAQSDLIRQLISSRTWPRPVDIRVGLPEEMHGKEFDVCFAVGLPPVPGENLAKANEVQEELLKVAISRARDALVLLLPDANANEDAFLPVFEPVKEICSRNTELVDRKSSELENLLLGSGSYLQDHTSIIPANSLSFDTVPDAKYLVRLNDTALAVQIRKESLTSAAVSNTEKEIQGSQIPGVSTPSAEKEAALPLSQKQLIEPRTTKEESKSVPAEKPRKRSKKPSSPPPVSFERVHSNQYGDGIIVDKKNVNGTQVLTVQFSGTRMNFLGEYAFRTGALTKIV